jgi:predicted Zn finger-like uncharacterized protein
MHVMQTRCPSCETIFRITEIEASASGGMVQCGVCQHFFNALKHQDPASGQKPYSQADLIMNKSRSLAKDELSSSLAQSYVKIRPRAPWWSTLTWTVLILLVLAALLLQLAWFNRQQLVLLPELKPYVERACQQLNCRLKPNVDLGNIELLSRDVRSHPTHRNALLITATFINRATFEQPYPDVGLVLSDLGGNIIAQRQFKPVEYLKTDLKPVDMMLKEVPVTLVMEVQDPGSESVSFRFEFL